MTPIWTKLTLAAAISLTALTPSIASAHGRGELARDRQELRRDRAQIHHEQRQLARAVVHHNPQRARAEAHDVRAAHREYREDRREYREDRRDHHIAHHIWRHRH